VLQAIPYNQLSLKQKETLAKLSKETSSPVISSPSLNTNEGTRYVTLKAGQVLSADVALHVKPNIQIVRKVVSPLRHKSFISQQMTSSAKKIFLPWLR